MKLNKKFLYEILIFFLLLMILFFPVKYFSLYYSLIIGLSIFIGFLAKGVLSKSFYLFIFIALASLIFLNSILSAIYFNSLFSRNITELLRFIPVIILLANYKYISISFRNLFSVLSFYTIATTLVNFLQFIGSSAINIITEIYNDPDHIENSLEIANRSLGLSPGPGPNGIIFVILFIFFYISFISMKYRFFSLLMMIFSILSIFFSQSQTAFVAVALVAIFITFIWFIENYNKTIFYKTFIFIFIFISFGVISFFRSMAEFRYLNTLFEQGLNRSSYQSREVKVNETLNLIFDNNLFLIIGHAKDYIPNSSALDNEYLFIISVYGAIGFILIVIFYIYNTIFLYLIGYNSIYKYLIIFSCIAGLVIAWPSSFLLDPRILLLLTIYIISYLKESNEGLKL